MPNTPKNPLIGPGIARRRRLHQLLRTALWLWGGVWVCVLLHLLLTHSLGRPSVSLAFSSLLVFGFVGLPSQFMWLLLASRAQPLTLARGLLAGLLAGLGGAVLWSLLLLLGHLEDFSRYFFKSVLLLTMFHLIVALPASVMMVLIDRWRHPQAL